jgi:hypothetical protein
LLLGYFSATTLTTVGFGDLAPETALGKLCTVIYIFVDLGVIGGSSTRWPSNPGALGAGDKAVRITKERLLVVRICDPPYAPGFSEGGICSSLRRG